MKDITITSKQIKHELKTLLVCFVIGFFSNVGAIVYYKSPALETITSLPYVLVFAGIIYLIWMFLRSVKWALFKLIKKASY